MPRKPRLHVPGGFYHVTLRGNHRGDIFFKASDREALNDIVSDCVEVVGSRVHAFCWMSNHIHLLVQVGDRPLGHLMQRLGSRYARWIQRKLATSGHLFERRYHALLVDVDEYFLELLRYVHLNPVRARIVERPEAYPWSSHRVYLGQQRLDWVTTDFALACFHANRSRAVRAYQQFVNQRIGAASDPSLYEGHPDESRVLGGDKFVSRLQLDAPSSRRGATLAEIEQSVCQELGCTPEAIRSASQTRDLTRARGLIAARALAQRAAPLSEIARFLNRSASAVARSADRYRDQALAATANLQSCKPGTWKLKAAKRPATAR